MERRAFVAVLAGGVLAVVNGVAAQSATPGQTDQHQRWGQQAEKEFGLGRGLAPTLMTEKEWKEHQQKMQTMTPQERAQYREQVHQQMTARAQERGIPMPRMQRAPDAGPGSQSGPGPGMGSGMGGMGGGMGSGMHGGTGSGMGGGMGPRGGRGR